MTSRRITAWGVLVFYCVVIAGLVAGSHPAVGGIQHVPPWVFNVLVVGVAGSLCYTCWFVRNEDYGVRV